jgi:hypothetical protein
MTAWARAGRDRGQPVKAGAFRATAARLLPLPAVAGPARVCQAIKVRNERKRAALYLHVSTARQAATAATTYALEEVRINGIEERSIADACSRLGRKIGYARSSQFCSEMASQLSIPSIRDRLASRRFPNYDRRGGSITN